MRRLLILVMIVLLPLRSWAGDLMGVEMAARSTVSAMAGAMPPGCAMHHSQPSQAHTPEANVGHAHSDGKTCASCGLCIPMAELAVARLEVTTFAMHTPPLMGSADFMSASLAPTVKPPIF